MRFFLSWKLIMFLYWHFVPSQHDTRLSAPLCRWPAHGSQPGARRARPCREHLPSRQRLLYFLYALTASSLRTNTTSATPTLTRRALFRAPHTQNSSCKTNTRTHAGWMTASVERWSPGWLGEMHLRRCPLRSLGDAGCSQLFSSLPTDWQQAGETHSFVFNYTSRFKLA